MDVIAFLEARIRDDEDAARIGLGGSGATPSSSNTPDISGSAELLRPLRQRVLDESAAKRAILLHCMLHHSDSGGEVLAILARVYRNHPDYRECWPSPRKSEWPPQGGHAA